MKRLRQRRQDTKYRLVTKWYFNCPIEMVWDKLTDIESWPVWWKGFNRATTRISGTMANPVFVVECEVRGFLPYTFRFSLEVTTFRPPTYAEFKTIGDLEGNGKFVLELKAGETECTLYWNAETIKTIPKLFSKLPLSGVFMIKNYESVMNNAYRHLKLALEE